MTTTWDPSGIWAGETVAVLGAGPDMTEALAATARGHKTIAVNRAVKFAPWADMFVALDPHHPFWDGREDFAGLKVIGVPDSPYEGTLYCGILYETVEIAPGHTIQIRNNALAAIRVAARAGAAKILLLGFDPERYEEVHAHTGFRGLVQGLEKITVELRAKGIEVERVDSSDQRPGTRPPRRSRQVLPIDPPPIPVSEDE